jgi:capsule polysaccharide export protein KpsC/LpsZ
VGEVVVLDAGYELAVFDGFPLIHQSLENPSRDLETDFYGGYLNISRYPDPPLVIAGTMVEVIDEKGCQ